MSHILPFQKIYKIGKTFHKEFGEGTNIRWEMEKKKKYQVVCREDPGKLEIIFEKVNLASTIVKQYKTTIFQNSVNLGIFELFKTFSTFSQYLCSHPQILSFDEDQFIIIVKLEVLGEFRYLYLEVEGEDRQSYYLNREKELTEALLLEKLHIQAISCWMQEKSQNYTSQIEKYINHRSRKINECKREQTKLEELDQKMIDVTHQSIDLDEQVSKKLNSDELKRYHAQTKHHKKEEKEQIAFRSELTKIKNTQIVSDLLKQNGKEVKKIDIDQGGIKKIKFLRLFPALIELRLARNLIVKIEGLNSLIELVVLDLSENRILRLQGLNHCVKLKTLIMHTNRLTKIQNIFNLTQLEYLSVSNNHISAIPAGISSLKSLAEIRAVNNNISQVSEELRSLPLLQSLSLIGNPCFQEKSKNGPFLQQLIVEKKLFTMNVYF